MKSLNTLWKFSRPHTVIGSVISIFTLYIIICRDSKIENIPLLLTVLIIGVSCNIFIVGINQIADVNIDKINKPYLPIPAGTLKIKEARIIVIGSILLSLILAFIVSPYLGLIIFVSGVIGWAYSMPPVYLKQHHLTAAMAITFVRGVLINLGGFMVVNYIVNKTYNIPTDVRILAAFIIVFSLVISWFKDLPDIEGDATYKIKTLAIVYSPRFVFITGSILIILTYLISIFLKYSMVFNEADPSFQSLILFYGNIILLILFIINSFSVNLQSNTSVKKFYKRFWWFFFGEYMVYLIAYLFYN